MPDDDFSNAAEARMKRIWASVQRKHKRRRVMPILGRLNREETSVMRGAIRHGMTENQNQAIVKWLVDMVEEGMRRYGMTWEE